jgi:hypothetical protein
MLEADHMRARHVSRAANSRLRSQISIEPRAGKHHEINNNAKLRKVGISDSVTGTGSKDWAGGWQVFNDSN